MSAQLRLQRLSAGLIRSPGLLRIEGGEGMAEEIGPQSRKSICDSEADPATTAHSGNKRYPALQWRLFHSVLFLSL
jgi:hypothetical protein